MSGCQCDDLLINNATSVRIIGLTNSQTGEPINDAACTVTLKDSAGVDVSGAVDVPLEHQEGTAGNYVGLIPSLALTENARYTLYVQAVLEGDVIATWEPEKIAKKRGSA